MNQVIEFLSKIPLFNQFTPEALAYLSHYVKVDRFPAGSSLVEAGATAGRLIVVLRGRVGINRQTSRGPVYETGGPGTIIGVVDIFGDNPASTSVRTEEETTALTINRPDFASFLKAHPEEAASLLDLLSTRLSQAGITLDIVVPPITEAPGSTPEAEKTAVVKAHELTGDRESEERGSLYPKNYTCAFCGTRFSSLAAKSKDIRLVKTDSDFCPHYQTVNPLLYEALVCPQCGYAFTADMPAKLLNDRTRASLAAQLPQIRSSLRFDGARDFAQAVEAFRLAAVCAEIIGAKKSVIGKIYLKIAWLHRSAGNEEEERLFIKKAILYLEKSYQTEHSTDPASELNLLYLLGDLNLRLGQERTATQWFSTVLNHPLRSASPAILNRTRDRWYEIRRKQKEESEGQDARDG
uniref:DUF2225 domain-containing protein n=1 Tax=Ammonifex degensii TaxID=42838 RepID=A0A7C1F2T7_9THEO